MTRFGHPCLGRPGLADNLVDLVDSIFFEKDLLNSTLKSILVTREKVTKIKFTMNIFLFIYILKSVTIIGAISGIISREYLSISPNKLTTLYNKLVNNKLLTSKQTQHHH